MDYFTDPLHANRLPAIAESWLATPFRARTRIKNGGVDCVNLISAVMEECGVAHEFQPPDYLLDWGQHGTRSQLLDYLSAEPILRQLQADEAALPGDILTFRVARVEHHAGIQLSSVRFIHTTQKLGTVLGLLTGKWADRLSVRFRVMEI